jgi:hypothetical protein
VHRVGRKPRGDRVRPHHFRAHRQRHAFLGQAAFGVGGDPEAADAARRIGKRRNDRVPAVKDDGGVRALAVTATPAAPVMLLTFVAGAAAAPHGRFRRVGFGVPSAFPHARFCHARVALAIRRLFD